MNTNTACFALNAFECSIAYFGLSIPCDLSVPVSVESWLALWFPVVTVHFSSAQTHNEENICFLHKFEINWYSNVIF